MRFWNVFESPKVAEPMRQTAYVEILSNLNHIRKRNVPIEVFVNVSHPLLLSGRMDQVIVLPSFNCVYFDRCSLQIMISRLFAGVLTDE